MQNTFIYLEKQLSSHLDLVLLVKWNFVGQGERQLTLDIGDTVHIEEFCDGKKMIYVQFKHDTTKLVLLFFVFLISSILIISRM